MYYGPPYCTIYEVPTVSKARTMYIGERGRMGSHAGGTCSEVLETLPLWKQCFRTNAPWIKREGGTNLSAPEKNEYIAFTHTG